MSGNPGEILKKQYDIDSMVRIVDFKNFKIYFHHKNGRWYKLPNMVHQFITNKLQVASFENDREIVHYFSLIIRKLLEQDVITESIRDKKLGRLFFLTKDEEDIKGLYENIIMKHIVFDPESLLLYDTAKERKYISSDSKIYVAVKENDIPAPLIQLALEKADRIFIRSLEVLKKFAEQKTQIRKPLILEMSDGIHDSCEELIDIINTLHPDIRISIPYSSPEICSDLLDYLQAKKPEIPFYYTFCNFTGSKSQSMESPGGIGLNSGIEDIVFQNSRLSCGGGKYKFYIDKNGDIYPCIRIQDKSKVLGNITTNSIEGFILNRKQEFVKNVETIGKCASCNVRYFCGGGCMDEVQNDEFIFCDLVHKRLNSIINGG